MCVCVCVCVCLYAHIWVYLHAMSRSISRQNRWHEQTLTIITFNVWSERTKFNGTCSPGKNGSSLTDSTVKYNRKAQPKHSTTKTMYMNIQCSPYHFLLWWPTIVYFNYCKLLCTPHKKYFLITTGHHTGLTQINQINNSRLAWRGESHFKHQNIWM